MNVRWVDDEGSLWFLSASNSRKNRELDVDPRGAAVEIVLGSAIRTRMADAVKAGALV